MGDQNWVRGAVTDVRILGCMENCCWRRIWVYGVPAGHWIGCFGGGQMGYASVLSAWPRFVLGQLSRVGSDRFCFILKYIIAVEI